MPDSVLFYCLHKSEKWGEEGNKKWYVAPQTVNNKRTGKDTWRGTLRCGLTENYGYTFARCYVSQQAMVSEEGRINILVFFDSGIWCGNIKSSKNKTASCHHWMEVVSPTTWTEHVPINIATQLCLKIKIFFCFYHQMKLWKWYCDQQLYNCVLSYRAIISAILWIL